MDYSHHLSKKREAKALVRIHYGVAITYTYSKKKRMISNRGGIDRERTCSNSVNVVLAMGYAA